MTRIVWVLLFQRWKAELSGDSLLRATVHGQWGVFFEGQQDEESGEGHPTAIVKSRDCGTMCLDLACWSASLRANDPFFSHKQTLLLLEGGLGTATAPLPITCIRAIAALAVKGGRDSDCLPPRRSSTPVGCLGRLVGSGENSSDCPMRGVSAIILRGSAGESLPWLGRAWGLHEAVTGLRKLDLVHHHLLARAGLLTLTSHLSAPDNRPRNATVVLDSRAIEPSSHPVRSKSPAKECRRSIRTGNPRGNKTAQRPPFNPSPVG